MYQQNKEISLDRKRKEEKQKNISTFLHAALEESIKII
jgi:hypothetical protein